MQRKLIMAALLLAAIAGCATQPPSTAFDPPGFFAGMWHGLIMFPSIVVGLFTDVRIYAFPNSGYLYDVGYVLGAAVGMGSGGAAAAVAR